MSKAQSTRAALAAAPGVNLVLLWHMHQPDYRDRSTGEFTMPWVYLHALKDYADMAWHLEQHPRVRAVVNFVPVLLDQIEDYCDQFNVGVLRDPLLRLLARSEATPLTEEERRSAMDQCFRADHHRLIAPYPPYQRLHELFRAADAQGPEALAYLSDRYVFDLVTWYHLSWTGETVRRDFELPASLMSKGSEFTHEERTAMLRLIADQVRSVIPRYRKLAESGQVELTATPHCHPLAPLMLDFECAHDALPGAPLPQSPRYPGGMARVQVHLDVALASHERRFGAPPIGMWPAEGALSNAFASMLAASKLQWTASGEGVLANSLRLGGTRQGADNGIDTKHQPYRASGVAPGLTFFFRDDRLSDLIGFTYSKWHGRDAAHNFIRELEAIGTRAFGNMRPVVSVMLDGENAWEYYPYNAFYFFADMYKSLSEHPYIRTVTGRDVVAALARIGQDEVALGSLQGLAAGSWVYGNLATWIGSKDKNRAWDLLCQAKSDVDDFISSGQADEVRQGHLMAQLADCEASDWFWWPGDENPSESVLAFESLFRSKLANLYRLMQRPTPEALLTPLSRGGGEAELGGTMKRGSAG